MKKLEVSLFLTIILMSAISLVHAQNNTQLIEELRTLIKNEMQTEHFVGVGAAFILNDSVVWKEGFGYADKENKIPFTTQTALNIGSITKPFTAMGIMQLHEKNLLDVDKPLVDYLPEFIIKTRKTSIKGVTVKSVIQHTSGIPNDILMNNWDKNEKYTNTVDYLKDEYLGYPVNMLFHYSNVGYCILGHTISKVSHQDYPNYIQDHILKPIGMNNSGFMDYYKLQQVSKTYDTTGSVIPLKQLRNIPAGGIYSTIDDMTKIAKEIIAIYHGKKGGFLKPETLKKLEELNHNNIENINTGLGWPIFKNDSSLVIMHSGSNNVSNAVMAIDLKRKNAIVFFVNTVSGLKLTNEAFARFSEFSGISTTQDQVYSFSYKNSISNNISDDSLKMHSGIYVTTNTSNEVKFENDKLIFNSVYGDFELKPQTNNEFLPGFISSPDSIRWLNEPRFIFTEFKGYKLMYWQDAGYKRQLLGHLEIPKEINEQWKNRLGKYKFEGHQLVSWDTFEEAELSIAENNLLQLKILYKSGEYLYYMHIENDSELVFCGFDTHGGETISFSKDKQTDIMKLHGLTMRKNN